MADVQTTAIEVPPTSPLATLTYAEWMVADPSLVIGEEAFRAHHGSGADQKMDRATLDLRLASMPEGSLDPQMAAARKAEDEKLVESRRAEDSKIAEKRKHENVAAAHTRLLERRKEQDHKLAEKRKAEDAAHPHDHARLAAARKAEDAKIAEGRKAEDARLAAEAKVADEAAKAAVHPEPTPAHKVS